MFMPPQVPAEAIRLAKLSEGCKDGDLLRPGMQPYLCPARIPTIGWGTTVYPDGRRVTMDDPGIDEATAESLLMHELHRALLSVRRLITVPLTTGQIAALIDFVYNLGAGKLQSSTLRRRINRLDPQAYTEFMKWVWGGGRKLPGLITRRQRNIQLWTTGTF